MMRLPVKSSNINCNLISYFTQIKIKHDQQSNDWTKQKGNI